MSDGKGPWTLYQCGTLVPYDHAIAGCPSTTYYSEETVVRMREALAHLVRLKDGPRDEAYEREKPLAWDEARAVLADVRSQEER